MRRTPRDLEYGEHVPGQLTIHGERPRLLSLFTGTGALDMAVAEVLDADVIAHAEVNSGARRLLAHRFPGVPNVGDVTRVDWRSLGPVQIVTAGFPCQDVSLAGLRLGIRHDTRSGLWAQVVVAVDELRPQLVVIENVRGLLSARAHHPAHSDMEPCPWCLARPDDVSLRALGAVLGDLSDLGYDAAWRTLRAADVGAPHGRDRVFVIAWPADPAGAGRQGGDGEDGVPGSGADEGERVAARRGRADADTDGRRRGECDPDERRLSVADPGGAAAARDADGVAQDGQRPAGQQGEARPAARRRPPAADADRDGRRAGAPAHVDGGCDEGGHDADRRAAADVRVGWGRYGAAVRRWAAVLGRPAPSPTEVSDRGTHRLSPRFVEWMMGLPDGWVVDVPGLSRNEQLRMLGNGVVPQQAAAALRLLLDQVADADAPPASDEAGGAA